MKSQHTGRQARRLVFAAALAVTTVLGGFGPSLMATAQAAELLQPSQGNNGNHQSGSNHNNQDSDNHRSQNNHQPSGSASNRLDPHRPDSTTGSLQMGSCGIVYNPDSPCYTGPIGGTSSPSGTPSRPPCVDRVPEQCLGGTAGPILPGSNLPSGSQMRLPCVDRVPEQCLGGTVGPILTGSNPPS